MPARTAMYRNENEQGEAGLHAKDTEKSKKEDGAKFKFQNGDDE